MVNNCAFLSDIGRVRPEKTSNSIQLLPLFLKSSSQNMARFHWSILTSLSPTTYCNRDPLTNYKPIKRNFCSVPMCVCILIFSIQQTIRRCHKSDDIRNVAVQFEVTLDCVCLSKLSKQTYHLFPIAYMVHLAFNKSWVLTFNDTKRQCL